MDVIHHPANLAEFDALLSKNPFLIVDFYADWCPPCKMIAPFFEQLATQNSPHVAFAKVNTDHQEDIAARYDVMSMPTFLFFKDGQLEGAPLQGAIPHVLAHFTGVFAQLARERNEAAAPKNTENTEEDAKDADANTVSGGYALGSAGKRSDWKMSLHL